MPTKPVTIRRWEIALVLVVLTASYVLAVVLVNREADRRATTNRELIEQINRSRAEITYTTCKNTNDRHDATVRTIDSIIANRKEEIIAAENVGDSEEAMLLRAQLDAIDAGRSTTVSLIDALSPLTNCEQLVRDRFGYVPELHELDEPEGAP
jgi:hypothetical protein